VEKAADQRDLLHQARIFGLQPKESEHRPPEAEPNRFGVSVVKFEEKQNFSEGKFVRVEQQEKIVLPFTFYHGKASAAEKNSETEINEKNN